MELQIRFSGDSPLEIEVIFDAFNLFNPDQLFQGPHNAALKREYLGLAEFMVSFTSRLTIGLFVHIRTFTFGSSARKMGLSRRVA
ncbi:MAG: hypothetical protein J2P21_04320 [Chloracidobacterium sp.]|nr:hypothetical protein [Chloracidobacterium sp.]